jgi:glycosyltransferase involved in cell wall biosynthesis
LITFDSFIGVHLGIPFLSFIGDVMYKYYPELPEYPFRHRWIRNLTTKRSTKYAELVIVDSEESKKDLIKFFGVPSAKLRPIRLCAPPHIFKYANGLGTNVHKLIAKHHIPSRFIFYPAQFWSHKNHANLVRALDLVRRTHSVEIPAVFVGSAQESYESLQALIKELGMDHQVHCLGYLPEEEVVALYKKAIALVFASFADYTSIPVVEAMVLGTPIVCSRIFSLPEQVGDAGVFFDPFNVEDMAEAIYRVWADEKLRQQLAENGRQRADELSPENFRSQWMALIHEALENGRG